jgi:hypothetical protein
LTSLIVMHWRYKNIWLNHTLVSIFISKFSKYFYKYLYWVIWLNTRVKKLHIYKLNSDIKYKYKFCLWMWIPWRGKGWPWLTLKLENMHEYRNKQYLVKMLAQDSLLFVLSQVGLWLVQRLIYMNNISSN